MVARLLALALLALPLAAQVTGSGVTLSGVTVGGEGGGGGGGTGSLQITRISGNYTSGAETADARTVAPLVEARVDSGAWSSTQGATVAGLAEGSHTAEIDFLPAFSGSLGRIEAGTCSYSEGGSECLVSTFNLTPTCTLPSNPTTEGSCTQVVSVTGGSVTKVVFRYTLDPEGYADISVDRSAQTLQEITTTACQASDVSTPGSLRKILKDCRDAGGAGCFIYPAPGLGELDLCGATIDNEQLIVTGGGGVGGNGTTLWGWTRDGGLRITRSPIITNPNQADGACVDTDNILWTGLDIDAQGSGEPSPLAGLAHGFTSNSCGALISSNIAVIGSSFYNGPSGDDSFSVGAKVQDVTLGAVLVGNNTSGTGLIIIGGGSGSAQPGPISLYGSFIGKMFNRSPWVKYRQDTGGSAQAPSLMMDMVSNLVMLTEAVSGGTRSGTSEGGMLRADRNLWLAAPSMADFNGLRTMNNFPYVCMGGENPDSNACAGLTAAEGFIGAVNGWFTAYNNWPAVLDLGEWSNIADPGGSPFSDQLNPVPAALRAMQWSGARPLSATASAMIAEAKTEFDKINPSPVFESECDNFTGWSSQGGMTTTAVDPGSGSSACEKTNNTPSVMYAGEDDGDVWLSFLFKTGDAAGGDTVFLESEYADATTAFRLRLGAGVIQLANPAGVWESIGAVAADTWYRIRVMYRDRKSAASGCAGGGDAETCSHLGGGVTGGSISGTAKSLDVRWSTETKHVGEIRFTNNHPTSSFFYDNIQVGRAGWCYEGLCSN